MLENLWEPTPERLRSCYEEILRLGTIVADLEQLERLERLEDGAIELNKSSIDLLQLASSVCASFESEFANKKLKLTISGEPTFIELDKDRIAGVIANLTSNAVKFTPENGQIRVSVVDSMSVAVLTIEDSGGGIPESELPFVFERFYRADKSRNRDTGGAGIGLAIAKSAVTLHGGTITAENVSPGGGCRFVVTLPRAQLN
jgi:signal transduction histidine kinase